MPSHMNTPAPSLRPVAARAEWLTCAPRLHGVVMDIGKVSKAGQAHQTRQLILIARGTLLPVPRIPSPRSATTPGVSASGGF